MSRVNSDWNQYLQAETFEVSKRAAALRYLFQNLNLEGSGETDSDAQYGIGILLHDIEKRTRRVAELLDSTHLLHPDESIEINWSDPDPISRLEKLIESRRSDLQASVS